MERIREIAREVARPALVPLGIFLLHVFLTRVVGIYGIWKHFDLPMHFAGGFGMAYFLGHLLPAVWPSLLGMRSLLFAFAATATVTVAVLWEFCEFGCDRIFGTRIQSGIADTMCDLFLGMVGALAWLGLREALRRKCAASLSGH